MASLPLDVRPIYSRDQGIRLRGLKIHRLRLNRHLPKVDLIARHAHAHSQILLYLGGAGFQRVAGETHEIRRGSLFFVPPHAEHSFVDARGHKPLCLAFDLDLEKGGHNKEPLARTLTLLDLKRVRQELSLLTRWRTGHETVEPREAAAVLRLIDLFFRALGFLAADRMPAGGSLLQSVRRVLTQPDAQRQPLGVRPDPGRMPQRRAPANRLAAALAGAAGVGSRLRAGFDDPNYFARWFRAQTGYTPTAWKMGGVAP